METLSVALERDRTLEPGALGPAETPPPESQECSWVWAGASSERARKEWEWHVIEFTRFLGFEGDSQERINRLIDLIARERGQKNSVLNLRQQCEWLSCEMMRKATEARRLVVAAQFRDYEERFHRSLDATEEFHAIRKYNVFCFISPSLDEIVASITSDAAGLPHELLTTIGPGPLARPERSDQQKPKKRIGRPPAEPVYGEKIIAVRGELSQERFAKRCGLGVDVLQRAETRDEATDKTIDKICAHPNAKQQKLKPQDLKKNQP